MTIVSDLPKTDNKEGNYRNVYKQVEALLDGERDLIANLANVSSVLHRAFNFLWTGFYIIRNNELVLGPFQGPVACTRIAKGKGVCGTAWETKSIQIVPNVHEFDGHIACSAESNSEIVLPFYIGGNMIGVLDVDSDKMDNFDSTDAKYLGKILNLLDK